MAINLSIAIVTRNRAASLEKTLISLGHQNVKPFEIIISDDSDDPAIIQQNKSLANKYGCIYITGPRKGLYANRNFVARHINGTHLRTMDDDHTFPENHLKVCMEAINKEPGTIWAIGEYNSIADIHAAPHPIPGQLHPRGFSYFKFKEGEYYGISCGATIYPKSVIHEKYMNAELYRFGIMYLEYGARLKSYGYTIKPLTDTYIIHIGEETSAIHFQQQNILEARIFSMFCLSFKHQSILPNKIKTILQLVADIFKGRANLTMIKNAWMNYEKFTSN